MPKLTDTQLVILSAAANRDNRCALPLPKSLAAKDSTVTKTLEGLCMKGLLVEQAATRKQPVWREGQDGQRMTLVITDAGLQAIDVEPASKPVRLPTPTGTRTKKPDIARKPTATKVKNRTPAPATRPATKQALLIDLLKRKEGATIDEIVAATGWQAHSVRGAISGTLKKKLGMAVTTAKTPERGRVYRIAEAN